jgi:hypothetical protein
MPFWLLPRSAKSRKQLGNFISLSRPSLPKSGDCRLTLDMPLFIRSVHGVTLTPPVELIYENGFSAFSPTWKRYFPKISIAYRRYFGHLRSPRSLLSLNGLAGTAKLTHVPFRREQKNHAYDIKTITPMPRPRPALPKGRWTKPFAASLTWKPN